MPVRRQKSEGMFEGPAFDPETAHVLGEAYDLACRGLHDNGQPDIIREMIADRIIRLAHDGERDPQKLSDNVLQSLGIGARK